MEKFERWLYNKTVGGRGLLEGLKSYLHIDGYHFANTANGDERSNIFISLIETAKQNKLDPNRYILYVLGQATNLDPSSTAWAEQLLPENPP